MARPPAPVINRSRNRCSLIHLIHRARFGGGVGPELMVAGEKVADLALGGQVPSPNWNKIPRFRISSFTSRFTSATADQTARRSSVAGLEFVTEFDRINPPGRGLKIALPTPSPFRESLQPIQAPTTAQKRKTERTATDKNSPLSFIN